MACVLLGFKYHMVLTVNFNNNGNNNKGLLQSKEKGIKTVGLKLRYTVPGTSSSENFCMNANYA